MEPGGEDPLIQEIVEAVRHVGGIRAIVLGGSRGRGTHTPASDYDLCFYYHPDHPLDLEALNRAASRLDDDRRERLLTGIGGWGPWINGGGWLRVRAQAVDFLYRDLRRVRAAIEDCRAGRVEIVYQPGHPHGFLNSIYMAETAMCRLLWDPAGEAASLKAQTEPYPPALQQALIARFAWEIRFSLEVGRKSLPRRDLTYAAGCAYRSAACMLQVLFALNQVYWMNEKGAAALADRFPIAPPDFKARLEHAFQSLAASEQGIHAALQALADLAGEIEALVETWSIEGR